MAITYTKQPPTDKLISLNNSILEFTTNLSNTTHAIIINSENDIELKIYPSPSGVYWANLKELYKTFFEMVDNVEIAYGRPPNITFVDNDAYKSVEIGIAVYNATTSENDVFEINLMRYAVQDLEEYKGLEFKSISPLKYTYFKGYPFDVQFWMPSSITVGDVSRMPMSFTDLHITKGINRVWGDTGDINSALFSAGYGTNLIYYKTKTVDCEGIYLKWLATDGSWRYWLFNQKHKETLKTKSLGQIFNDWFNPTESNAPSVEIGKTAERTKKLHATGLEHYEMENIQTLVTSPKVYIYKGTKGSAGTLADFYEVELLTQTFNSVDYGRNQFNIEFEIKLREQTISLI